MTKEPNNVKWQAMTRPSKLSLDGSLVAWVPEVSPGYLSGVIDWRYGVTRQDPGSNLVKFSLLDFLASPARIFIPPPPSAFAQNP